LELFANGDAHLNVVGQGPKLQVLGTMTIEPGEAAAPASFAVHRIWRARWTSRCRKDHQTGGWVEEAFALGHRFTPGSHSLTLRSIDERSIEVCAERCEVLEHVETVPHGTWRHPELLPAVHRGPPELPAGTLLSIELHENRSTLWFAQGPDRPFARLHGRPRVALTGDDQFSVHVRIDRVSDADDESPMPGVGSTVLLNATRQRGERLHVCAELDAGCELH
jgi:hypothetical protein